MQIIAPYAKMMSPLIGYYSSEPVSASAGMFTRSDGIAMLRRIEYAARVSHRSEDAITEDSYDRLLRSVVMQHGDLSVIEHEKVTVEAVVDRGITHEWVRHRIGSYTQECVSGDTWLTSSLRIKDAYNRGLIGKKIRSSDGNVIVRNAIANVFDKGLQPVYQVTTERGYRIKSTLAHEFQTIDGRFERLESLRIGSSVMVNGRPCLLHLNDTQLYTEFFDLGTCPQEIADKHGVPYSTVTRRLRQLGVFRDRRNDKNKEKYNKNHTPKSRIRMRDSILSGYRNGRTPWNKGLSEADSPSVGRQVASLREHQHHNGSGESNSNWKGGVRQTQRRKAQFLKKDVTACEVCDSTKRLEVHHIDEVPSNNNIENLVKLCRKCHVKAHSKFRIGVVPVIDEIVSILYVGIERVYDLEMATHHNYLANGFIVHNSTRFVNYKKKGGEAKVIKPDFLDISDPDERQCAEADWHAAVAQSESSYMSMLARGVPPQIARSVLPTGLASKIVVTYNLRSWRHFFIMRTSRETHPQMKQVSIPLLHEFQAKIPLLFDDIVPEQRQADAMRLLR